MPLGSAIGCGTDAPPRARRPALPRSAGRSQQAPAPPVFGAAVELVRLDVLVLDEEGRPVTGLAREDFVVEEDGRPQAIESFEPVVVRGDAAGALDEPPAAHRAPACGRRARAAASSSSSTTSTCAELAWSGCARRLRRFLETDVREGDWVTVVAPEQQLWWTARTAGSTGSSRRVVGRLMGQGGGRRLRQTGRRCARLEYGFPA